MKLEQPQRLELVKPPALTLVYTHGTWEARDDSGTVIARGDSEQQARDRARTYYALVALRGRTKR